MGQGSGAGLAIVALLAIFLLTGNGAPPTFGSDVTIKEFHYLTEIKSILQTHKTKIEYYRERAEEYEQASEEHEENLLLGLTGLARARAVHAETKVLQRMVRPTTTFNPLKLTKADLDKAEALALKSRPAYGSHGQSVPIE